MLPQLMIGICGGARRGDGLLVSGGDFQIRRQGGNRRQIADAAPPHSVAALHSARFRGWQRDALPSASKRRLFRGAPLTTSSDVVYLSSQRPGSKL